MAGQSIKKYTYKILLGFIFLSLFPLLILFGAHLLHFNTWYSDAAPETHSPTDYVFSETAPAVQNSGRDLMTREIRMLSLYALFVSLVFTWMAIRWILRPIRNLSEGVNRLGSGNFDFRLPESGNDEVASLASAFNAMADSLQKRNEELGRKELYIEKMLDPLWVLDTDDRICEINPAFSQQFGYERNMVVGRNARDFLDGPSRQTFDDRVHTNGERGFSGVYELSFLGSGERRIPVLLSCSPVPGNGRIAGSIGVFKDIAIRKELEEGVIRKNNELFALNTIAAITSQSMDLTEILKNTIKEVLTIIGMDAGGIYWVDEQKREIACAGHIGVPESFVRQIEKFKFGEDIPGLVAITGDTIAISNVIKDPRMLHNAIKQSGMKGYLCLPLKSKEKVQGILCMLSKEEHCFTTDELEFLESVGHIVGVAIENIKLYNRERARLSGLVSLEKNRAEAILSSIGEAVYTTDRDFVITYWNRAAEEATGFKADEVVGKTCIEVLGHENENGELLCGSQCVIRKAAAGGTAAHNAFCLTRHGRKLLTALISTPIKNEAEEETGRVTVFRDITREKEVDRMKTEFVRTVSHELRTPLSAIVGMTEMLIDGEIKDKKSRQEYLQTIYQEGQRLATIVEELLDIARIESGREELKKIDLPVQPLIESCIQTLSDRAVSKGVRIQWDGSYPLPMVRADREKLHRVIFNLLNNAVCYCDRGSTVTISAETKNGYLTVSLADTGWGIPEHDLPHIFKKFYRSKEHAHLVKGTGLGLPLVLEIIKAHDGKIEVESKHGLGSRFTLHVPLAM